MRSLAALTLLGLLIGAARSAEYPAGFGRNPSLPEPEHSLVPTVKVAPAKSWPAGASPSAAEGMQVMAFAKGLHHPRWLYVLPDGDVLVAETDAPSRPEDGKGLKAWFMRFFMKRAGSTRTPSPNRITLLRDADGDGVAEVKQTFLSGLNSPFGMALVGDAFYVANTDALLRFRYSGEGVTQTGEKIADLPDGPINHHWTKNVIASEDGKKLYVTIGSNSNVGENGLDKEKDRAAILQIDADTGQSRIFASGLRNPVGLGWQPQSRQLWTVVNERDELGPRPSAGLPHLREGGRLLRLALQLLRPARRRPCDGAEVRSRRQGYRARLRARRAHGLAGACVLRRQIAARALPRRRVHRSARLLEPRSALRLQSDLRSLQGRPAVGSARGHPHWLP